MTIVGLILAESKNNEAEPKAVSEVYKCSICGKICKTKPALSNHNKVHKDKGE